MEPTAESTAELWALALKLIAALGGIGVIVAGASAFAANFVANRSLQKQKAELGQETERLKGELAKETETHKLKLRKQELLFEKQLEAAVEFFALRRRFEPKYRYPEMDWYEALEDLIQNFSDAEKALQEFSAKHGPILSAPSRKDIESCTQMASAEKFSGVPGAMTKRAGEVAETFLETMKKIEESFVKELKS